MTFPASAHPFDKKRREIFTEALKLPKMKPLSSLDDYPMCEEVGMQSQLALYHRKDVEPHQLIWRELEVSTHLLNKRLAEPIEHAEAGYVGDFEFQPPHAFKAFNRGATDTKMHPARRASSDELIQETRGTRSTMSSGGWTNDEYHRDTDVQRVSDGRMFMFDCDAEQPDDHFCQGPLPPSELPSVLHAGPPQPSALEAISPRITSFGGELLEPLPIAISQVSIDGSCKASIKSELLQDNNEVLASKKMKSLSRINFFKIIKAKCLGAFARLVCARRSAQQSDQL